MGRLFATSGSPLEGEIGFCRAVRVGNIVAVAGTAPIGRDGTTVGIGDAYAQTMRCLEIVDEALAAVGAALTDVTRTRMMMTDVGFWPLVAKAHGDCFGKVRPVTTFVQVAGFIDARWLVEVEVDAVIA